MIGKFEPKLTYVDLGHGKIEVCFRWAQRRKDAEDKLTIDLDIFEEYKKFAETPDETRFRHLANAVNWDTENKLEKEAFLIRLLYYFPFQKVIQFRRALKW